MRAAIGLVSIMVRVGDFKAPNYSAAGGQPNRGFAPQISGHFGGMFRHTKIS
jgi:hypothetical protein